MKNDRGAGRKKLINEEQLSRIKDRLAAGESVTALAREYGVSRQALYKRLNAEQQEPIVLEYLVNGEVTSRIYVDTSHERVRVENLGNRLSAYAFGINVSPNWDDFQEWLEKKLLERMGLSSTPGDGSILCCDVNNDTYSLQDIVEHSQGQIKLVSGEYGMKLPRFYFTKSDIRYTRSDTDGFQLKALSYDRKLFVKGQAIIGGIRMDDWAVELIASDLCEQLGIPCVKQHGCELVYNERTLKGVYSDNFELDGYTFVSFERLAERTGYSTSDSEFAKLAAIDKLKWCAERLSEAGKLRYEETLRYMLNLALIDCLVGNVDRHTKNFGLFFDATKGRYEIPPLFDNGMGLFEHDNYKERYTSFDAAMGQVYVAPYGEDPFDMIEMLDKEFDLMKLYPGLATYGYHTEWITPYAKEYMERMISRWQK